MKRAVALAVFAVLAGCSLTPTYERPNAGLPESWADQKVAATSDSPSEWNDLFKDAELQQLMSEALAANHDLAAAATRIEQAKATAKMASSRLAPYATLSVGGSRQKELSGARSLASSDDSQLSVNYELDLWGANRANVQSAAARVAAREYDMASTRLVLQADVASYYFQTLALKDRLAIAQKNLEAARSLMSLVEVRYDKGAASGLDVAQQRTALLNIEAEVPQLQQSLTETQSALALLLGRVPQAFTVRTETLAYTQLPAIAAGQPGDLLQRRPDVRAAEADLVAANADIGVARAALYPNMELSATGVVTNWLTGGSASLASLATSLTQVLFDGGELRGQVQLADASRRELVETYLQTVLTSVKEVNDSLSAVSTADQRTTLLSQTVEQAQLALRLATTRYQAGSDDLLTVLESQTSQLNAEDSLVQAKLARVNASITLFKALGGGWEAS
ncbi:efflux transporter outer membrane subunit [Peristeroidobacter agariperforans]|uniref:efflux transporter outer membrane subunit n=1 Tax=Peristeroidobacter agariperforans TaxID=268404 RepID=UPI0013009A0F|nr:efflux transporter outer membrane subunit [Peristeroidobacter agariperforans]